MVLWTLKTLSYVLDCLTHKHIEQEGAPVRKKKSCSWYKCVQLQSCGFLKPPPDTIEGLKV